MYGYEDSARFYDCFEDLSHPEFFGEYARDAGTVLDVAAGTGQVSLQVLDGDTRVVAVEPSPSMASVFREKLDGTDHADRVEVVEDTAEDFEWAGEADAGLWIGGFDHLLTHEDRVRALENVADHLAPGSPLVFDAAVWTPEEHDLTRAGETTGDGRRYERHVERTVEDDRLHLRWVYRVYEDDELVEEVEQRSVNGVFGAEDVLRAVRDAGLRVEREWAGFDRSPFDDGGHLVVEASVSSFAAKD